MTPTPSRILKRLRSAPRPVWMLAAEMNIKPLNANLVLSALINMERDGLVKQTGERWAVTTKGMVY